MLLDAISLLHFWHFSHFLTLARHKTHRHRLTLSKEEESLYQIRGSDFENLRISERNQRILRLNFNPTFRIFWKTNISTDASYFMTPYTTLFIHLMKLASIGRWKVKMKCVALSSINLFWKEKVHCISP